MSGSKFEADTRGSGSSSNAPAAPVLCDTRACTRCSTYVYVTRRRGPGSAIKILASRNACENSMRTYICSYLYTLTACIETSTRVAVSTFLKGEEFSSRRCCVPRVYIRSPPCLFTSGQVVVSAGWERDREREGEHMFPRLTFHAAFKVVLAKKVACMKCSRAGLSSSEKCLFFENIFSSSPLYFSLLVDTFVYPTRTSRRNSVEISNL